MAAAFPQATVYVHERGARHLVDPTKLVNSAAMVYGDLLDSLYGRLTPTDAARVRVLEDGDEVVVSSNRTLTTVDSPGHAKHHLALHDSDSGLLFAGDAGGCGSPTWGGPAAGDAAARLRPRPGPDRRCGGSPSGGPRASPSPTSAWSPTRPRSSRRRRRR